MSKNNQGLNSDELLEFKDILSQQLEKVQKELSDMKERQQDHTDQVSGSNRDFNESSKGSQRQAKNDLLIQRLEDRQREILSALERIENGSYGIDENTGKVIDEARLRAKPTARHDII